MEETPAVMLDDIITKLAVIRCEIWDDIGGDEDQLSPAERLVLTLADDLRRVIGQTTTYRFDARLGSKARSVPAWTRSSWVVLVPSLSRRPGAYDMGEQWLGWKPAAYDRYEPPQLTDEDARGAIIEELIRSGRADYYRWPAAEPAATE